MDQPPDRFIAEGAKALIRIWSELASNLPQRFCRLPDSSFFVLPSHSSHLPGSGAYNKEIALRVEDTGIL
jgi:hypothetical protein